jgi:hypothetical protein
MVLGVILAILACISRIRILTSELQILNKIILEKIAIAFKEKNNNYNLFLVIKIYKIKNKKI